MMSPSHTLKNGTTRYRYYRCTSTRMGGRACPGPSVSAPVVEGWVESQFRERGELPEAWAGMTMLARGRWLREVLDEVEVDGVSGGVKLVRRSAGEISENGEVAA
jgi:hypothetical protein